MALGAAMKARPNTSATASVPALNLETPTGIPPLLDADGVRKHLAPISRSTLYSLATAQEIVTVSVGVGRGRRCFLTASIIAWLQRRADATVRPKIAARKKPQTIPRTEGTK